MPDIYELAAKFRRDLLTRDAKSVREILSAYGEILKAIEPQIINLQNEIASNPDASIAKILANARFEQLKEKIGERIADFVVKAVKITSAAQKAGAGKGYTNAADLIRIGLDNSFIKLPTKAIENFVGSAGDGSPLAEIFSKLAPDAIESVKNKIIEGIALGYNPKKTASQIRQSFGANASRAAAITRTESLRAYRESTREVYQANSKIVKGWIWSAQLSTRTCALCWAMHGTKHSNDEPMATHPCCRCAMLPDLGKFDITTGAEKFAQLPIEDQIKILGFGGQKMYADGEAALSDFVGVRQSAKWGKVRYQKSLKNIKKNNSNPRTEASVIADNLLQKARKNENSITQLMQSISNNIGGQMRGLSERFKSKESLVRKLTDVSSFTQKSINKTAERINDTLRYTFVISQEQYVDDINSIKKQLEKNGYSVVKIFNGWEKAGKPFDTGYRGVNITVLSSQQQLFELQLHTEESFNLKTKTHGLYEEFRSLETSKERKKQITRQMIKLSRKLNRPKGI